MNSYIVLVTLSLVGAINAGQILLTGAPIAHLAAVGSGVEGKYVPDNQEKLYDDGSYRPELQPIPLSASPFGLVPAGSGLEGAYVHDNTETLYNDGSYHGELIPTPFAASPYGLVPAGSGLEGQYVHDHTENLYDDGSYKHGLHH